MNQVLENSPSASIHNITFLNVPHPPPFLPAKEKKRNDVFRSIECLNLIVNQHARLFSMTELQSFGPLPELFKKCVDLHDRDLSTVPGQEMHLWFYQAQSIFQRINCKRMQEIVSHGVANLSGFAEAIMNGADHSVLAKALECCASLERSVYRECEALERGLLESAKVCNHLGFSN